MDYEVFDWNSIILGVLATCLFAECIILVVRVNSMRNKMEVEAESIRKEELVKYEKKRNELEMLMKEREFELKSEYEGMLARGRAAKREQEEKLAETKSELVNAKRASERAEIERVRYAKMQSECKKLSDSYAEKLARISGLDVSQLMEEARREVLKKCESDLSEYRSEILEAGRLSADSQARRILADSMQRLSSQLPQSSLTSTVKIPDEAMKGRLIGKEGRNIRSFEASTGTTLIIDETPECVMISSFNPTRREVAKIALEKLVADGRINPSSIEQSVDEAKKSMEQRFYDIGAEAVESLSLARVNPDILALLGRLSFHLSLNQDTLLHSVETAKLCAMIAAELGCDAAIAKRIGLFHDIGKAMPDSDLSHARAGASALLRSGESEIVANAVEAHHGEAEAKSIYAAILQVADSLSATRPGARMEATEGYIRRIRTLEKIASDFDGVESAYVLQAGRELRVMVSPDALSDVDAARTAKEIRKKIEENSGNSIPVKVTVIRERRYTA